MIFELINYLGTFTTVCSCSDNWLNWTHLLLCDLGTDNCHIYYSTLMFRQLDTFTTVRSWHRQLGTFTTERSPSDNWAHLLLYDLSPTIDTFVGVNCYAHAPTTELCLCSFIVE